MVSSRSENKESGNKQQQKYLSQRLLKEKLYQFIISPEMYDYSSSTITL